ncbi:CRIB domain-containing protein RIC7-like [Bidens hawaiensis]|uniref:CRIB domain-containing protein RIC7-like n=1 Tax=Bidens hawaiensis TaxID=980011 RepID=UPI004049B7C2
MGTKVKGLIRGIKNISSQIFEEEKEQELQIGQPTDVKHVAHIGGDGPAVESPSWMKGFESKDSQSGPLEKSGAKGEAPQLKCISEDITHRKARKDDACHRSTRSVETSGELPLLPRSTKNRRRSMDNHNNNNNSNNIMASETKDSSSSQPRQPRRHHRGPRRSQDQNTGDDPKLDIPKKSSRRIRKPIGEGPTRSSAKSTTDDSELGSDDQ